MPFIYKPFRQTMSPNNVSINPAVNNDFTAIINGQICVGYRFRVFDMDNVIVSAASKEVATLGTSLYDGDTLTITINSGNLVAGNKYKWIVDLYSSYLTLTGVDTSLDTIGVANHNLSTGDMIFMQTTGTYPTYFSYQYDWVEDTDYIIGDKIKYAVNGNYYSCKLAHTSSASILPTNTTYWDVISASTISAYTKYYVRAKDKDNLYIFENIEAARNNTGKIDFTGAGTGTITICNIATSDEIPFSAYSVPTASLTVGTLTTQSHEFVPTYTHTQGILVNKFQAFLYNEDGDVLDSSDEIYSSNVRYTFDGFLSGNTYGVKFVITNNAGQECNTGIVSFSVSYSSPSLIITADAENICKDSCIKISWGNLVQIIGEVTGDSTYIENYLTLGDYGLSLDISAILEYAGVGMEVGGTLPIFIWQPITTSFTGIIAEFTNTDTMEYVKIYYDGSKFYQDRNGVIMNNLPFALTTDTAYLIAVIGNDLYTKSIGTYTPV